MQSIYWHDYEAFGADARRDRASQFAGVRTDLELNEIAEPLVIYCKPALDYLPHPQACLVTGITPQLASARGVPEAEFIRRIHEQFSQPETCVAGYNNIRYDDELSRQLFYRNFYDAYEREWKHGNSRWDMIDVVRLWHAVRPEGLQWPRRADGLPSFRLEDLTTANELEHESAHDALSDVRATIALARLLKKLQPKLFEFAFNLRFKHSAARQLDVVSRKPLLHVSSWYGSRRACVAPVMPLTPLAADPNAILVYDLSIDPEPWLDLNEADLRTAAFRRSASNSDGSARLPVMTVYCNRCPVIAPLATITAERLTQLDYDLLKIRRNWHLIQNNPQFIARLRAAMTIDRSSVTSEVAACDPDFMLYSGGFFSDSDKRLMLRIRSMSVVDLSLHADEVLRGCQDGRLREMLFRYRARNYGSLLNAQERSRWLEFCRARLMPVAGAGTWDSAGLTVDACLSAIAELRSGSAASPCDLKILDELQSWVEYVCDSVSK
jgi:exodeoxyribonuclease I